MAFEASLAKLPAEASCPICLDYPRDPVTTKCGHNFCDSCIHQRWEGLQDTFPCPVCLHHCPDRSLKRNPQLCHMNEVVQQIPRGKRKRQEKPLCKKHRRVLVLFCERDLELLCAQCRVVSHHENHPLVPIDEAAANHRRMLKKHIKDKNNHLKVVKTLYKNQVEKTSEVKSKIGKWREELVNECKKIKSFLAIERNEIENDLLMEEKYVEEKLMENGRQLSSHMFRLGNLLSEIEDKCLQTDLDLLTDIKRINNRYENLETPAIFSCDLKKGSYNLPPHYLGLHKMIRTFLVDLTLDTKTAHRNISTSFRRHVTYLTPSGSADPQDLTSYPAVLSSEGFDAGRHFWAVVIEGTGECFLGVCKESFPRNTHISPSAGNGCWKYSVCIPKTGPSPTGQMKIGIFLDYELGEVSFYNLNDCSYLYRTTGTFTEKLKAYFSVAATSESLEIKIIRGKR